MKLQNIIERNLVMSKADIKSNPELTKEIQTRLNIESDGIWGINTDRAVASFCAQYHLDNNFTGLFGACFAQKLVENKHSSTSLTVNSILPNWQGGNKEATIHAIVNEARHQGLTLPQIAYVLATTQHETAGSFQPVEEGYYLGKRAKAYQKSLRYYPFYGRGYVQLTWEDNHRKYSKKTGLDLVKNPDLVLRPDVALFILIDGMKCGEFTGHNLDRHINSHKCDFVNARRIINGKDCAVQIAGIARDWLSDKLLA